MKHKIMTSILYSALILIGVSVFIILFWLYSPPKEALSISPNPIPVVTKQIQSGKPDSFVVLRLTRCKNVRARGRIVISLVGQSVQLTLPVITDTGERKCDTDASIPIPLPTQALPGTYHYHFRTTYSVNPLTTIIQDFDSEEFSIE